MTRPPASLLAERTLTRNAIWNLLGMASPLLVALVAVPPLIAGMGTERFGLLAIVWMLIGYFSLFDLGLGRALTKLIAERVGTQESPDLRDLLWTALWLILTLGVVAASLAIASRGLLVSRILNVPPSLQHEALSAILILALGIPVVVFTAAVVGVLEAHQQFGRIAAVRAPLGIVTFLGPLATLQFTPSLVAATGALLAARCLAMGVYYSLARTVVPSLGTPVLPSRRFLQPLFSFGGWLTVSNIVGPLMVTFDRFALGAILTMSAVTYYVTPYEVLSRLSILPRAAMGVLFPALATAHAHDLTRLVTLFRKSSRVLLLVMLPPVTMAFLFAPEALAVWLGQDFSEMSASVARWLAIGVLINTIARVPYVALQGTGRPDLTAKLHALELVPYFLLLWWLIQLYGVTGAALAWTIRVTGDTLALLWMARSIAHDLRVVVFRNMLLIPIFLVGFLALWQVESLSLRGLVAFAITVICALSLGDEWRRLAKEETLVSPYEAEAVNIGARDGSL